MPTVRLAADDFFLDQNFRIKFQRFRQRLLPVLNPLDKLQPDARTLPHRFHHQRRLPAFRPRSFFRIHNQKFRRRNPGFEATFFRQHLVERDAARFGVAAGVKRAEFVQAAAAPCRPRRKFRAAREKPHPSPAAKPSLAFSDQFQKPCGRANAAPSHAAPERSDTSRSALGHTVFEIDPKTPDWVLPPETDVVCLAPLHGTYGEDGTVQRQLEKLGVPYTGCDAESSRIAFDKVLTKKRCLAAGVPTAKFLVVNSEKTPWPKGWQPPLVVKPVRQGSSVGLQFVERKDDWPNALAEALKFDSEVLVEEKIVGRETTVGILDGKPLPVVEVRPKVGSYDYKNKYTAGLHGIFLSGGI